MRGIGFVIMAMSMTCSVSWCEESHLKKVSKLIPQLKNELEVRQIIGEIKLNNLKNKELGLEKSMLKIHAIDKNWRNSVGVTELVKPFIEERCSDYLRSVKKKFTYIAEVFVMDDLGAIVCESNKTSDYWQGDEVKWKKSYNQGKGKVYIGEAHFDDSTQAYLMQVSIPIRVKKQTIGVITIGIDLDQLD